MTLKPFTVPSAVKTRRFVRRGEVVNVGNVPPECTVLELLRDELGCTGTKEGCGEGDCGACTVVLGQIEHGALRFRAVNSCIRLAHSIDGMALWTVEDIAPTLVASRTALPPEGALRLRPGKAGSAAPTGEEGTSTLATSRTRCPRGGLSAAAPSLPAQAWTVQRAAASRSVLPARPAARQGRRLRPRL